MDQFGFEMLNSSEQGSDADNKQGIDRCILGLHLEKNHQNGNSKNGTASSKGSKY